MNNRVQLFLLSAGIVFLSATLQLRCEDDQLYKALREGAAHKEVADLINAGADVTARITIKIELYKAVGDGTYLHLAAQYNANPEVIDLLIKAGAKVNERGLIELTPLHLAAIYCSNPAVIEALIKAGADVNAKDKRGLTPLHEAAHMSANPDIIKALVKAGADVNAKEIDSMSPLHEAVRTDTAPGIITALIKAGADVNAKTSGGKSVFDLASENKNPKILAELQGVK